ncbi:cyclase family protein [Paenibacillus larvae]|nr:cyclase family protein [Paenibacillus larvae]
MFIGQARVIRIPNKSVIGIKELSSFDLDGVTRLLIRTDAWPDRTVFPVSIPYMDPQAIGYLSDKGIRLIGFDLPSVDPIESKTLLVHHQLSHADISILEGLVLDHIDAGDYEFIALPFSK